MREQATERLCPALLVGGGSSDSGKTTFIAALARYWRNQGKVVRVFKIGPDFIDPKFHEVASGQPCYQLDLGMMGEDICRQHLYQAAQVADLILIEGVMGLFDGQHSSASFAIRFGIPVLAVLNAAKMAQTFGALAHGLATYQPDMQLYGVMANRVGSAGHAMLLADSLPESIVFAGALPRDEALILPERHLGLVQAQEIPLLDNWLDSAASKLAASCELKLPPAITFSAPTKSIPQPTGLEGITIAVARDAAFTFIYQDNLDFLQQAGANLSYFSPLVDQALPRCDALYLAGGYPELHMEALTNNIGLKQAIHQHAQANKPILAECGGMLYLLDELTDKQGVTLPMCGLLKGKAQLQQKLAAIGMMQAPLQTAETEEIATGHTFHFSTADIELTPWMTAKQTSKIHMHEAVYLQRKLCASYVHWYFPSAPTWFTQFFAGKIEA